MQSTAARPGFLEELAASWHQGRPRGIYSVCSAHPWVLEAAMEQALADSSHLLIEATSNQVNHCGGYTGMTPQHFRQLVSGIASVRGFDPARLILGGDHLGPNPWQHLPAAEAMREAVEMVQAYVRAGFHKIHLDASMACADDRAPLSDEIIAERAATLCAAAEEAAGAEKPVYIIGTEVPVPGGATESLAHVTPTSREAAAQTLAIHRRVFAAHGLASAWPRVIALVVQPGVEFNHDSVINYEPARATHLTDLLREESGLVYEAHSTDYQRPASYPALVRDGFAILKVGPALTFAMREALQALASIESELIPAESRSDLMDTLERVMLAEPQHWKKHYTGDEESIRLLRRYSYSDRIRYYWTHPQVKQSVETLIINLRGVTIPETMLSGLLPEAYQAVRTSRLTPDAHALILFSIRRALQPYAAACRP